MKYPSTLQEAVKYFSEEKICIAAVAQMRWPDGVVRCPFCVFDSHYWLETQKRWKCRKCYKQFSVKRGTIFQDSPLGLDKWMVAMWMLANCRNGISSYEIARTVGISQKSAWHMMHRIREAMKDRSSSKIGGDNTAVEVDETYIGGNVQNMHKGSRIHKLTQGGGARNKAVVMGAVDRMNRQVRAEVVPGAHREIMTGMVQRNVKFNSTVYTDQHSGYMTLNRRYTHETINHMAEYVNGHIHTQGIENFWSLLKRGLGGTYIAVESQHLNRYVTEQVFRFNHRYAGRTKLNDADRFWALLKEVAGRTLTYAELTQRPLQDAYDSF